MADHEKTSETSEFEQITPAKISISPATIDTNAPEEQRVDSGEQPRAKKFYIALAALMVFAVVLFWALPKMVDKPAVALEPTTTSPSAAVANRAPIEASPWQDAQQSRERKITQDILEEFLDLQFALEEKRVELWGLSEYEAAKASAQRGDEAYRTQQFSVATEEYRQGLTTLKQLMERSGTVVEDALAAGSAALQTGDSQGAREAFELVLQVEPLNTDAASGLERSESLDRVFDLFTQAQAAETDNDLDRALKLLNDALAVDAEFSQAQDARKITKGKILERDYSNAMSRGFAQLSQGNYAAADSAFRQAASLKPGSSEAQDGISQVALTLTENKIAGLKVEAANFEAKEEWLAAKQVFESVLSLDSSVVFAQEGVARTATRVRLDGLLEDARNNPERLSTPSVNQETRQLLRVARTVKQPGPRLQQQINDIETRLDIALKPISVTLVSDSRTDVTMYKVGHLGSFASHQLSLRPGTYALVGRRLGYRDVRKEITVAHGVPLDPVSITCTEKI